MMRLLLLVLLLMTLPLGRAQQMVTQEQCQQADAQLNQVYQQLRGSLNDAQKQQLKQAQRDWIKQRDAFVAANPGNYQGALYQATMQRVGELSGFLGKTMQPAPVNTVPIASPRSRLPTVTQEELEATDVQLNQVYQEVRGALNESDKQQLKLEQKNWLKR